MSPIQPVTELHLRVQHIIALRKAIAIAVLTCDEHPDTCRLTYPDRQWLSQVERMLWPGWPPQDEPDTIENKAEPPGTRRDQRDGVK